MRKTGAIHRPAPASVPLLSARASLDRMAPAAATDWQSRLTLGDALGNDRYGCCVEAAQTRAEQLIICNAMGSGWTPTTMDALGLYAMLTGFNPETGLPDDGTDTAAAMTRWCSLGYEINPQLEDVPHWVSLDPANLDHQRIAIDTLGCVLLTLALPKAVMELDEWTLTPDGTPDRAPYSEGGHRVMCGRHDGDGLWLVTWGQQIFASPAFLAAYTVAADAVVSRRWTEATGLSPAGLDWDRMTAEAGEL